MFFRKGSQYHYGANWPPSNGTRQSLPQPWPGWSDGGFVCSSFVSVLIWTLNGLCMALCSVFYVIFVEQTSAFVTKNLLKSVTLAPQWWLVGWFAFVWSVFSACCLVGWQAESPPLSPPIPFPAQPLSFPSPIGTHLLQPQPWWSDGLVSVSVCAFIHVLVCMFSGQYVLSSGVDVMQAGPSLVKPVEGHDLPGWVDRLSLQVSFTVTASSTVVVCGWLSCRLWVFVFTTSASVVLNVLAVVDCLFVTYFDCAVTVRQSVWLAACLCCTLTVL